VRLIETHAGGISAANPLNHGVSVSTTPQAPSGGYRADEDNAPTGPTASIEQFSNSAHQALLAVARRRREDFPGLLEHLEDNVALHVGLGSPRAARGWFRCAGLVVDGRAVDEIHLNIEPELPRLSVSNHGSEIARSTSSASLSAEPHADVAVQVLTTLVHEATHVWNSINNIKDCCRDGRYHNRRFGLPAVALGLAVVPHTTQGVVTPGLLPWAQSDYNDLLDALGQALVLSRLATPSTLPGAEAPDSPSEASGVSTTPQTSGDAKYASAVCACTDQRGKPRRLRMARGAWELGPVRCGVCSKDFALR
jgi:hypothetical protein